MAIVQLFDRRMIERYLREKEIDYITDSNGDFITRIGHMVETGCELLVAFLISGEIQKLYTIHIESDKEIPRPDWGRVVMICNAWNQESVLPKAFLNIRDGGTEASIVLENQIFLASGIHPELFREFTDSSLTGAVLFWKWAHQEKGL